MTISQSIIVEITLFHFYTAQLIWSCSVKMGRSGSLNGIETLKKKSMTLTYSFRFPFQTRYLSLYIPLRFRKHAINSNKMNIPKHLRLQLSFHHINDQSKPASVHDLSITVMKNSKWPNFQFLQMKKKNPKKERKNRPISSSKCFPKPQIEHIYPIPANGSYQTFIRIMAITLRILKPNKRKERKKVLKMENWRQIQIGFLQRLLQKTFFGVSSWKNFRRARSDGPAGLGLDFGEPCVWVRDSNPMWLWENMGQLRKSCTYF